MDPVEKSGSDQAPSKVRRFEVYELGKICTIVSGNSLLPYPEKSGRVALQCTSKPKQKKGTGSSTVSFKVEFHVDTKPKGSVADANDFDKTLKYCWEMGAVTTVKFDSELNRKISGRTYNNIHRIISVTCPNKTDSYLPSVPVVPGVANSDLKVQKT